MNHSFSDAVLYPYHKRYFEKFDTGSCTNFFGTFDNLCFKNSESDSVLKETFDLSNWDVSNATTFENMFSNINVEKIDISNWKNKEYADASGMFYNSDIKELIANNTLLKAEYVYKLFGLCCYLKSIDISFIDHIGDGISDIFSCCESLTELDLSTLNVSNVLYVDYAFDYCYSLEKLNLSNWNLDLLRDTALAENDFESYTECIFDESTSIKHITLENSTTKTINTFIELVPERSEDDMGTITGSVRDAAEEIKVELGNSKFWLVSVRDLGRTMAIKFKNSMVYLYHKGKKLI
jgi:surface protein